MKTWRNLGVALVVAAVVWLVFSWPLPRYFGDAVPYSVTKWNGTSETRAMVPGDHLQMIYHFWLFADMLQGHTPFFHNIYEFNVGSDAARFQPGAYYVPFSLIFAVGYWLAGIAVGWNLIGLVVLWLTYYFTWRLLARYAVHEWVAAVASLVAIMLPFPWLNLGGGSPAGFALIWIPVSLFGIDLAVRDGRVGGGLLAGLALLFSSFCDLHIWFFLAALTPFWVAIAALQTKSQDWRKRRWVRIALAGLLWVVCLGLSYWILYLLTPHAKGGKAVGVRSFAEAALFSPDWHGLWSWFTPGACEYIFVGMTIPLFLVLGLWLGWRNRRSPMGWQRCLTLTLVVFLALGVIFLALGPNGPGGGLPFKLVREVLPPFRAMRQPMKIFCLMPVLLALGSALALSAWRPNRWGYRLVPIFFAIALALEGRAQMQVGLCRLDKGQGAYAAVKAAVHKGTNVAPRVLVLPLWPGDSHYTAVYLYYAAQEHLRLVNGYKPSIGAEYQQQIFGALERLNEGMLGPDQLKLLQKLGVEYLVLHENLFPEKVSPVPVAFTLRRLLNDEHLKLLAQDGPVWSFRILDEPVPREQVGKGWRYVFTHRSARVTTPPPGGGPSLLSKEGSLGDGVVVPDSLFVPDEEKPRLWFRVKGTGVVEVVGNMIDVTTPPPGGGPPILGKEGSLGEKTTTKGSGKEGSLRNTENFRIKVKSDRWVWKELAVRRPGLVRFGPVKKEGSVAVDRIWPVVESWHLLKLGETVVIPAVCFYHAGYSDLQMDSVVFSAERDPRGVVFYGPKMPFDAGKYRFSLEYETVALAGTVLGRVYVAGPDGKELGAKLVVAGEPAVVEVEIAEAMALSLFLEFYQAADLVVKEVAIGSL